MSNLEIIKKFPKNFIFGTATSSYQIEGQKFGGCGLSNWDTFAKKKGKTFSGHDGSIACAHILNFEKDLDLVKECGLTAYRFSFSWPRLYPNDDGKINNLGLEFYDKLLDSLLEKNLLPFATFYHWDLPKYLDDKGGWTQLDTLRKFCEFSNLIMDKFGKRIHSIATINEPWCVSWLSHYWGEHAPGIKSIEATAKSMHNILLAHGNAVEIARDYGHKNVGIVLNKTHVVSHSNKEEDAFAAKIYEEIHNTWFDEAIFKGKYPINLLNILRPYMPKNYSNDLKIISKKIDWIGVNYYTRTIVKKDNNERYFGLKTLKGNLPKTDMGWEIYPEGLTEVIIKLIKNYSKDTPIYITENGMANMETFKNGKVVDIERISFYEKHLTEIKKLLNKGFPLRGFFAWSLLDNFEWAFGYSKRFGLIYVDFKSLKRTPKKSWYEFKKALNK
tara:strand:+ start:2351 stop:3682 length:1332 start_codon:yes stop_codon:yes gene_type:complete